jgi:hypothetical protein
LTVRDNGRPGLTIESGCVHTLAEYASYRHATPTEDQHARRDLGEESVKLHGTTEPIAGQYGITAKSVRKVLLVTWGVEYW